MSHDKGGDLPNFGGILDGMANILGKLGDLADKGKELRESGSFDSGDPKKTVAGSFGYSVRFGPGGERSHGPAVQPLAKRNKPPARPSAGGVPEPREPHVDVFSESDHVLVIAEMPGVAVENVELNFHENAMSLVGRSARVHFEKHVELGHPFSPEDVDVSVNNGVIEIRLALPGQR